MASVLATAFVRVRADTSGFAKELESGLQGSSATAAKEGEKAGESFGSSMKTKMTALMNAAGKVGGLALAAGAALVIDEGSKLEDAQVALQRAIANTGGSWKALSPQIADVSRQMEVYGFTNAQTDQALTTLTTATGDAQGSMMLLGSAANLAAFKHIDLTTAATMLAKASGGAARALKDLGIQQVAGATWAKAEATANKDLADQVSSLGGMSQFAAAHHMTLANATQLMGEAAKGSVPAMNKLGLDVLPSSATAAQRLGELVGIMNAKIGGQAFDAANTTEGKMKTLKAEFVDMAAQIGAKLMPVISKVIDWLVRSHMLIPLVVTVMAALTAAFIASTIAAMSFAAALTGGIAIAVVVMAAIIIRYHEAIWKFIQRVWHDIKAWAMDAFNWVKDNWPLILGILTGPIGLAVVEIVKHWHEIVAGLQAIWGDITGFFRRLPGDILTALGNLGSVLWNAGIQIIEGLINGVKSRLGFLGTVLGGIGGFIAAHKGPLEVDAQLLVPHGKAMMGGLMLGIGSQLPALQSQLGRVTGTIGGAGGRPGVAGGAGTAGVQVVFSGAGAAQFRTLIQAMWPDLQMQVLFKGGGGPNSAQIALGQTH